MCFVFVLFDFETRFCYVALAILKFLGNLPASASQVAGTTTLGLETTFLPLLFRDWNFKAGKPCWSFLPCRLHRGTLCLTLHWVATGEFYEMQPLWEGGGTPLMICFQGSATSFPFIYKVCGSTHFTDRDESPKLCLSGKVKWGQVIIFKGNKNDKGRQSWVG